MENSTDTRQGKESKIIKVAKRIGNCLDAGLDFVCGVSMGVGGSFADLASGFDFGVRMARGNPNIFKIGYYATEAAIYTAALYAMFSGPGFEM